MLLVDGCFLWIDMLFFKIDRNILCFLQNKVRMPANEISPDKRSVAGEKRQCRQREVDSIAVIYFDLVQLIFALHRRHFHEIARKSPIFRTRPSEDRGRSRSRAF